MRSPAPEALQRSTTRPSEHPARLHLSLRQLELFACVARNESYSRAAEELQLTQPAVSVQIRNLEESIGSPLLEYVGRKLYLTDAGQELYSAANSILETLDRYAMLLADLKGLKQGRLRLSAVTTSKYFLPRLLGLFCARYPGIDAELKVGTRAEVVAQLERNSADLCIMTEPPADMNISAEAFMDNELVVIARDDHALTGQRQIALSRLVREPFLMREAGSGTRTAFEQLLAERKLQVRTRMEFASNETIKQAVLGGLGIAVVSRLSLTTDGRDGGIAILDVEFFPLRRRWHAVRPAGKRLSVIAREFLCFLHEQGTLGDPLQHGPI